MIHTYLEHTTKDTLSVLIVEDNYVDQQLISRMCDSHNFIENYQLAGTLSGAKQALLTSEIDLIITDYNLPDGKGSELIDNEKNLPVIVITGMNDQQVIIESMKHGAADFLLKDIDNKFLEYLDANVVRIKNLYDDRRRLELFRETITEIVENSSDLIFTTDEENKVVFANRSWLNVMGYTIEELEVIPVLDLIHPTTAERFNEILTSIEEMKQLIDEPIQLKSKDGFRIYTRGTINARFDSKGKFLGTQAILINVSETVRIKAKVEESERRYKTLVEFSDALIFQGDAFGHLLFINNVVEKLTGYSKKEVAGVHFTNLIKEENKKWAVEYYKRQFSNRKESTYLEFPIICKDGSEKWVGQNVRLLFDDDHERVTGFLGVVRDMTIKHREEVALLNLTDRLEREVEQRTKQISERNKDLEEEITKRKEAEELSEKARSDYEALFQNANDAILVIDPIDEAVLEVNKKACSLYGFTRKEFIGTSLQSLSVDVEAGRELVKTILERKGYFQFESKHLTKTGALLTLEINAASIKFNQKEAIITICKDVSLEREMNLKLQNLRKEQVTALIDGQELERRRFAKELHDSITQMMSANIFSLRSIKRNGELNEKQLQAYDETESISKSVIEEIRLISRNLMPTVLEDFGLDKALVNLAQTQRGEEEITYTSSGEFEELNREMQLSIYRIAQELLNNASKYASANSIDMSLKRDASVITLKVKDDGKGFDMDDEKFRGGNGFAGMKERAYSIGGDLQISSKINFGTEVALIINENGKN